MKWRENNEAWDRVLRYSAYDYNSEFTDDEEKDLRNLRKDFFHEDGRVYKDTKYKAVKRKVVKRYVARNKELLQDYLKDNGLSENELAKMIGVSRQSFIGWNYSNLPSAKSAEKVFDVCGIRLFTWYEASAEVHAVV